MEFYLQGKNAKHFLGPNKTTFGRSGDSTIRIIFSCIDYLQCSIELNESGVPILQNLAPNKCTCLNNDPLNFNETKTLKENDIICIGSVKEKKYQEFKVCLRKEIDCRISKQSEVEVVTIDDEDDKNSDNTCSNAETVIIDPDNPPSLKPIIIDCSSDSNDSDTMKTRVSFSQIVPRSNQVLINSVSMPEPRILPAKSSSKESITNTETKSIPSKSEAMVIDSYNPSVSNPENGSNQWAVECPENLNESSDKENEIKSAASPPRVVIEESEPESSQHNSSRLGMRGLTLSCLDSSSSESTVDINESKKFTLKGLDSDDLKSSSSDDDENFNVTMKKRNVIKSDSESINSQSLNSKKGSRNSSQNVFMSSQASDTEESYKPSTQTTETSDTTPSATSDSDEEPLSKHLPAKRKRRKNILWPSVKERLKKTQKTFNIMNKLCDE